MRTKHQIPKWVGLLIDRILPEARILGTQSSTARWKVPDLRYWEVTACYPDFTKWAGRYKQALSSVARKNAVRRNYPFNLELLHWVGLCMNDPCGRSRPNNGILAETPLGFSFY